MPAIELTLFGAIALSVDGGSIPLDRRKPLALLAFVAAEGRAERARLAQLLWPALDAADARRNLRRELARLREMGAGAVLATDDDSVDLAATVDCDARRLAALLAAGDRAGATALYRGEFAAGLDLDDAPDFADWLQATRERFARIARQALLQQAQSAEAAGDLAAALSAYERLHQADPLREITVRDLMRVQAAGGDRAGALRSFERFAARLQRELGLAPLPQSEALAAQIRSGVPSGVAVDPGPVPATAAPAPLPREAPFVGRASHVADMQAAWRAGCLLLVTGEAGEGKTRLATDFAALHGAHAHIACRPVDRELPFAAAARVLRALLEAGGAAPDEATRAELARVLPEFGAARPLASAEDRQRFFDVVGQAVRQLTADNFNSIVVDDWHSADASSQALLLHLAQQPSPQLRWLFAYRASELTPDAQRMLDDVVSAGAARRIGVAPLSIEEVGALVRALSRSDAPVFARRLQRATGGNPFFLIETLRHLFERGLITATTAGQWQTPFDAETTDYRELPIPPTVRDAVRARVARLGEGAVRLLEAASLVGDPFEAAWLDATSSLSDTETVAAFEAAEAASLLRHDRGAYRFAHDLVPQSLLAGLSPARAALLHRRLALSLERVRAAPHRIAAHWEAAGEPRRAVAHRLAAGEAAARLYAHREALAEFAQALADGPDPAQEVRVRNARIDALRHLGDLEARATETEALLRLARAQGDRNLEADASIQRALSLADAGRKRDALRAAEHAVALGPTDETALLRALRIAGWAAMTCGESEQARGYLERALPLAERIDASAACSSLSVLVRIAIDAGRYDDAARIYARARTHPGLTLRPMIHNQVLADGARLAEATGRRDEALALQREALAIAERAGASPNVNVARVNLLVMLLNAGRLAQAEQEARTLQPFRDRDAHPLEQYIGLTAAAQIAAYKGDWAQARALGERLVTLTDRNEDPMQQRYERVHLARVLLAAGDAAAARERARQAQAVDARPGRVLLSAAAVEARADLRLDPAHAAEIAERMPRLIDAPPVLEEERPLAVDDARIVRGWALLQRGQYAAARDAVAPVWFSAGLQAEALAVQLHAQRALGEPVGELAARAGRMLAGIELPAAEQQALAAALRG